MTAPTRTHAPAETIEERPAKPDVAADLVRLDDDGGPQIVESDRGGDVDRPDVCAVVNSVSRDTGVQSSEEHHYMNAQNHRAYGFVVGILTGTFVGAGLAMWLAPQSASELRQRMNDSARRLGQRASNQYRQATTRVGETVDEIARKGQSLRDDVADTVARGAHEVERYATAARSDRATDGRTPAADRSAPTL